MWLKALTLLLALVPWVIEKLRKDEAIKELEAEQKIENEELIDEVNTVRANAVDDELLLSPDKRKAAKLRAVQTDLRHRYGGSDEHPEVSGGSD